MTRWLIAALAAVAALALAAELVAGRLVDADRIRDRLADELAGEGADIAVGKASFSLLRRRFEATDVRIGRPGRFTVTADRIVAAGLPLGSSDGEAKEIGSLTVEGPLIYLHPPPDSAGAFGPDDESSDVAVRIGRLEVRRATGLAWRVGATEGPGQVLIRDLYVDGDDVAFDRSGRISGAGTLAVRTGGFFRTRADGLTRTTMDSVRASHSDSTFRAFGIRYEPVHDDPEFFARLEEREDRIRATIPRMELRGVDLALLPRRGFVIRHAVFDEVDVEVLSNRRIPAAAADQPWLPQTLIERVPGPVRIDSTTIRGRIEYSEIPLREVATPARIAFEDFDGVLTGISDRPETPLVLDAAMTTFGAPASIRLEIPLDREPFFMRTEGRVGSLPLPRLNELTIPLQGVEIQEGRLEGLRFDITVDGRTAGGTVWLAYDDLDVQMVDSRTGEGGLLDDIKSFVANTFALKGDNMPETVGDGAEPGAVEYYVRPTDSFFTRVWAPIRTGMMEVARK